MTNVLIVDDEEAFTSGMSDYLSKREFAVRYRKLPVSRKGTS